MYEIEGTLAGIPRWFQRLITWDFLVFAAFAKVCDQAADALYRACKSTAYGGPSFSFMTCVRRYVHRAFR